ncbi:hypothetical protein FNV43_RR23349 [Rhamnella rubrinervis]|uniref:Isopenicillin N synthase-like Fe(2+) 2OG dioxygenase domain-containing protein n=1 Tax=Rhamnella rubrinervis TaxID=2594499 RepID=A0A8K0GP27_9ROSA|nr:hypothetical protein FNV43_RR23349 [Rhamnella rubrinervis]
MKEDVEVVDLYDLRYSDLVLLSSGQVASSSSSEELDRLDLVRRQIMEALGPAGPGLLAISGVPNASALRRHLPLARKLTFLDADHRKRILKGHNLGSDVPLKNPGRSVSSFAMQLSYAYAFEKHTLLNSEDKDLRHIDSDKATELQDNEYTNLGNNLKELGFCMMELGRLLARVCDSVMGGQEMEQSLLESCTAKGRLIHYHSALDGQLLKQAARKKGGISKSGRKQSIADHTKLTGGSGEVGPCSSIHSNLWQQWHYDYGIFTVLTAPLFLQQWCPQAGEEDRFEDCRFEECSGYPSGHTYLQIFDPNKNIILMVKTSPETFIVQVGESAEILSKGKVRAALHSVGKPGDFENLSRETFVVFLQPAWNKVFSMSDYPMKHISSGDQCLSLESSEEKKRIAEQDFQKIVPPLTSRLKDGMTFAEFSRETTKQYYGGSGLQSNR